MEEFIEYNKTGGYISELTFNNGQKVNIAPNDIIVFVGPNNAGKSQSLKDINELCSNPKKQVKVISKINIKKSSKDIKSLLNEIAYSSHQGSYISYQFLQHSFSSYVVEQSQSNSTFSELRSVFIAYLDTDSRLNICRPTESISRNQAKHHPILYAAFNYGTYGAWLSKNFYRAFGEHLIPHTQYGNTIPLCIGENVDLSSETFSNEQERQAKYAEILDGYKQVHLQGDGVRSFTGILLYLMMDNFCTYLLDEPESFLHPPQAHIMGQIIGETLKENQQAFISTHSADIIKGLLDVASNRIKIIRITRTNDKNQFSILDNETFQEIWADPLLKYSNIMSGLFHKKVILCESDSDCKFYSIIDEYLQKEKGRYSENLYIHCGGKQRMAKVIKALKSLNVDVCLIPDFDVLNNEEILKNILSAFDIKWSAIEKDYKIIDANLSSAKETIDRSLAKIQINEILDKKIVKTLSKDEITKIQAIIKTSSKWECVKKQGVNGLPSGDASSAFARIDAIFKSNGIYIVPVGELECFLRTIGGHGPEWVNKVLEQYPDINNPIYNSVKAFIGEVL